jgi:hypothetical protein
MDGEGLKPSRGQWPSPPALSPLPDLSLPSAFGVDRGWRRRRYVYVMARCGSHNSLPPPRQAGFIHA